MPKNSYVQYKESGEGDNVIILIHGFISSSHYWRKVTPSLVKAGYRVIAIDLLGFGNAEKPTTSNYGYDDQVEYVRKIIDDIGLSKPVTIVGHSMGALIATKYTQRYKKNVQFLLLIHPPLYKDSFEAQSTLENTGRFYRFLLRSKYRNLGWSLLRLLLPRAIASHTKRSREFSLKNIILKAEVINDLSTISTKTLLIIGLKDRAIYQDNLSKITSNPHIDLVKENVDHHSPIKHPRLIQKHILTFIQDTSIL